MANGGSKTQRVDIIDSYDPRTLGRAAQKGTLFRYIPALGDPVLLIKADDGFTINWLPLGGGSAMPITVAQAGTVADIDLTNAPANIDGFALTNGDVVLVKDQALLELNGVYDFNGVGVAMTRNAEWNTAGDFIPGRQVFVHNGTANNDTLWADAGYVSTLGVDPIEFVKISSSVLVGDPNTLAYFNAVGTLTDNVNARFDAAFNSMVMALSSGGPIGTVTANANVALARGLVNVNGIVLASGTGSHAFGSAADGASVEAAGIGASGSGSASNGGFIGATGSGAWSSGVVNVGTLIATASGSIATGDATEGTIQASAAGASAHGSVNAPGSTIQATSAGSMSTGLATNSGVITAGAEGARAHGHAEISGSIIQALGKGSLAQGYAELDGQISLDANSYGSIAMGYISDSGGNIVGSSASGCLVMGIAGLGSDLSASGSGVHVHGIVSDSSIITASDQGSRAAGSAQTSSIITASGRGSQAHGYAAFTATMTASGQGSSVSGRAFQSGSITASGSGSKASGEANGSLSVINASATGALAHGFAQTNSNILASSQGASAIGSVQDGTLQASGLGALSTGRVFQNAASITASGLGAVAHGYAVDASSINATGSGSMAVGVSNISGSFLTASSNATFVFGEATDNAVITATLNGAMARGRAISGGSLAATGIASFVSGYANGSAITASGSGSFAGGLVGGSFGSSSVSGDGSFAYGPAHNVTAAYASAFGIGHALNSFVTTVVGQYADLAGGTPGAYITTDYAFVVGIGAGVGSENNGFVIFKDGKMETTGAQRSRAIRSTDVDTTLSDRSDRSLFVETDASGGPVTVTFPAGQDGLEFFVKDKGNNASVNNILFVPDGTDLVEATANITNNRGGRHFQFQAGTWYVMNMP